MKINMSVDSLSGADEQKIIYDLIKDFCIVNRISIRNGAIHHFIDDFDAVAEWAKAEKNLNITKKRFDDETRTYGIVFNIDETPEFTKFLLESV